MISWLIPQLQKSYGCQVKCPPAKLNTYPLQKFQMPTASQTSTSGCYCPGFKTTALDFPWVKTLSESKITYQFRRDVLSIISIKIDPWLWRVIVGTNCAFIIDICIQDDCWSELPRSIITCDNNKDRDNILHVNNNPSLQKF